MNIKQILLAVVVVGIFGAYIIYERFFGATQNQTPLINNNQENGSTSPSPEGQNNQEQQPTGLKDGAYDGNVANAFYGSMQVKAVISGGRITDVQFLKFPNTPGHTTELSNATLPQLKSEVIIAQKANVDVVSGATQTSQAFMQSLQSALVKAGAPDNFHVDVTAPGKF